MEIRSPEEVQSLFASTEDLVGRVLSHLKNSGMSVDHDEMMAFGREGLIEAAQRFDPEKGEDFRRYAYFRVKGSMLDGLRKMGNWSRRGYERVTLMRRANEMCEGFFDEDQGSPSASSAEAHQRLNKHMAAMVTAMTVGVFAEHVHQQDGSITAVDRSQSVEEELADQQMVELVRQAIFELPEPEDDIIRRHYVEGEKMDDIALSYHKSKSWVSRMHTRAIKRLGARLRGASA